MSDPHRILVVDDNPTNLKLVAYLVRAKGYTVDTALDAESALAAIQIARPDLILMDLQLPGIDGLELTRRLKADPATDAIKIIAVTAYAMKGDRDKAAGAGCDDYVRIKKVQRCLDDSSTSAAMAHNERHDRDAVVGIAIVLRHEPICDRGEQRGLGLREEPDRRNVMDPCEDGLARGVVPERLLRERRERRVIWVMQRSRCTSREGGDYHLVGGNYTAAPVGVRFSASATIKPAGLDCTVPQIANLKVSIMQESSNFIITKTWNTPVMAWAAGVAPGTTVNAPPAMRETTNYAAAVVQPVNDGLAGAQPLYSRQAGALMPPTGCAGGGAAQSSDTPGQSVAATFAQAFNNGGVPVGTVTWTVLAGTTRTENFRTYCVVINTVTNVFSNLKEAIWTLAADSTHPHQHVVVHAETAATANPAVGVQANFAADTTAMAGVGAALPIVHP